ncbi:MAG: ABC transporter substrate-binding protein [Desulfobacteraceae bacterium]|jgi:branched-chain amino acid transport system substrate-binding protein
MKRKGLTRLVLVLGVLTTFFVAPLVAQAQEVIKIGAAQPITGRFAFAGTKIHEGLSDYITYINERGGINGKKVEYIFEDTEYKVDKAVAIFKRIMAKDNPLIFYGDSTGLGKAIAPTIRDRYKVFYGSTSFSSELGDRANNPYVFVSGPTYSDMVGILLKYIAEKKPGAKVAFFYSDTEFGKDPIPYGKKLAKQLGLKLVADLVGKPGAIDVTSTVMQLKRKEPDYLVIHGFVLSPVPTLLKGCKDMGVKVVPMATFWGMGKMVLDKLGPLAEGFTGVMQYTYYWYDVPAIREMKAFNARHHPKIKHRTTYYTQGWFTGMIFEECLRRADRAGKLTGEGLSEALASIKNWHTGDLIAPVTFKNNKIPVAKVWQADVKKKVYVPISDWIYLD